MKIVIPLAGFGTRLRPHTFVRPKPLMSIAGKPVLGHLLDKILGLDISEYIFIVGYLGDQIEAYIKSAYTFRSHFVEQKELLGQSHAIWLAREYLTDEPTFVIFADTLFETDLQQLDEPGIDAQIFVKEVEDPRSFGVVLLDNEGYITRFVEKPSTMENRLAVVGLYYFRSGRALISAIEQQMAQGKMLKGEYFLADAMQIMLDSGQKFRTRQLTDWLDTGKPDAVLETNRFLLEHGHDNSAAFKPGPGVVIVPPVYIGPEVEIASSVIGPHVSIGAKCKIDGCVLRDTIIDDNSTLNEISLQNSLIGRNVSVNGKFHSINIADASSVNIG